MIEVRGLRLRLGVTDVLRGVGFDLPPRQLTVLAGPNGAGKTTIIRLLTRILVPDAGHIAIDGRALATIPRRTLARAVAVLPQGDALPAGFRCEEIVLMGRAPHLGFLAAESSVDHAVVERAMHDTGTWELRNQPVETLSGGERQRVLLARALAQEARYLLLDEPTSHLDLRYQVDLLRLTRSQVAQGMGVLAVLHDLNLAARIADRMLLLHEGEIAAAGTPEDVIRREVLQNVYRVDLSVFTASDGSPTVLPLFD